MTFRRAVVGAVTTTIACVVPTFLVGGLAVQISAELGFDPAGLGLAVSTYFAVGALASVPSGWLAERIGPAATAYAGIAVCVATLTGIAFTGSFGGLLALLAVAGVANALGQLASNAVLAAHVPLRRQGLSFGLKQSAIPIATLLSGLAVPAVALTLGWRWAFGIAAALAAAAALLVPRQGHALRRGTRERAQTVSGGLAVVGAAALLAAASANSLGTFLVDSAVVGGLTPTAAGLALTAGGAICATSRILGGWLADRWARGHIAIVAGCVGVGAIGVALLAVPHGAFLAVGVLLGFGLGWSWPGLLNYAVVRLHPQAPAAATSITQTGVYAGGSLGPLAFGATAAAAGYPTAWLGAATAMVLAAVLMLVGRRLLLNRARAAGSAPVTHGIAAER